MKTFKDFNIKPMLKGLTGDKIKIVKLLNREIEVLDYRIDDSKYGNGSDKCLCLQFRLKEETNVTFTGSKSLIDAIQQVPKSEFPFKTTIVEDNDWYEFT